MITAIVSRDDGTAVSLALTADGYSVTKLATTGGFLMSGNTTLLIGCEDERVEHALSVISGNCKRRSEFVPNAASYGAGVTNAYPVEVAVGGATIFVSDVERFEKL